MEPVHYQAEAIVHWTLTIRDRKIGWLSPLFYYRFRELMTHAAFRYELACPMFCLMPDHFHMVWIGLSSDSDQLLAMKHFRKSVNESLRRIGFELQDQAYDHVLQAQERLAVNFRSLCSYIARNPERASLVAPDEYATYPYTGAIIPGYPQLRPFQPDFWYQFDRTVSFLRREGLLRKSKKSSGGC